MARLLEDLTPEEKVDAALAILALEFVGQTQRVEEELDLDPKAVRRLKSQAIDAINRSFSDESEEINLEINIKDGLARLKRTNLPSSNKGKGIKGSRRSIPDLTEFQIERLRIIFNDLEEFNKKQPGPKKLKPTEGLLKAALEFFGLPAVAVVTKLPSPFKEKMNVIENNFQKFFPSGYPKRPDIKPFMEFLEKKYPPQGKEESKKSEKEKVDKTEKVAS